MAPLILVDATNIENEIFISEKGLAKAGQLSIIHENEKTFGTTTAHSATAPWTGDHKPFAYFCLEMNRYKSKPLKNAQKYPRGPCTWENKKYFSKKNIFLGNFLFWKNKNFFKIFYGKSIFLKLNFWKCDFICFPESQFVSNFSDIFQITLCIIYHGSVALCD